MALRLENMEMVRLRAAGRLEGDNSYVLSVMDAADEHKILMHVHMAFSGSYNQDTAAAMDATGRVMFTMAHVLSANVKVVCGDTILGMVKSNNDSTISLQLNVREEIPLNVVVRKSVSQRYTLTIFDAQNNEVGKISNTTSEETVDAFMKRSLDINTKLIITALAVKSCHTIFQIHQTTLPIVVISTPSDTPWNLTPLIPNVKRSQDYLKLADWFVIRPAGYNTFGFQYFDAIDKVTSNVIFTIKSKTTITPQSPETFAHCTTASNRIIFSVGGVLNDKEYKIYNGERNQVALFKTSVSRFQDRDGSLNVFVHQQQIEFDGKISKGLIVYDELFASYAKIYRVKDTVNVQIARVCNNTFYRALIISAAIRAIFKLYGLYKVPMPVIKYFTTNMTSANHAMLL